MKKLFEAGVRYESVSEESPEDSWEDLVFPRERVFFETGLVCLYCEGTGLKGRFCLDGRVCLACRGRGRGEDRVIVEKIPRLTPEQEREALAALVEFVKSEREGK